MLCDRDCGPWTKRPAGIVLDCRLLPKGSHDALTGIVRLADGKSVVSAKVRAVPKAGLANLALRTLLADALDLPVSAIRIEAGATGRRKRIAIDGEPCLLIARLERLFMPPP
jgi:uncharacterized protein